jgi:hypothetical protein
MSTPGPGTPCPKCGAPLTPGAKFCPSCGAAVASATPSPVTGALTAPSPPGGVDIRERVDQDRGALKRLQLLIPGFRAYRQGEDVRAADAMLRLQVADQLVRAMQQVDTLRSQMTRDVILEGLTTLGGLRSELQRLEGEIRHAEQGYTGISPALRITPEMLDRLYERDYRFIASGQGVLDALPAVQSAVASRNAQSIDAAVDGLRAQLKDLENVFAQRIQGVEGILH